MLVKEYMNLQRCVSTRHSITDTTTCCIDVSSWFWLLFLSVTSIIKVHAVALLVVRDGQCTEYQQLRHFKSTSQHADSNAILIMAPQGISSLDRSTVQQHGEFPQLARKWLVTVRKQLCELHRRGLAHGDVKPSNIVCLINDSAKGARTLANASASLIDFEHMLELTSTHTQTISGTHRYASRQILLVTNGLRCLDTTAFVYEPTDDMESLFYTAAELLHPYHRLPWSSCNSVAEAVKSRNLLLHDEATWSEFIEPITDPTSRDFLTEARASVARTKLDFWVCWVTNHLGGTCHSFAALSPHLA
jgi:serine/threonine protein kinase